MRRLALHFAPELVEAPEALPVTLEEATAYCRNSPADNHLVEAALSAAVASHDGPQGSLGRCLMPQTWRQPFADFTERLALPFPAISLVEVAYVAEDGETKIVDPSTVRLVDATGLPHVIRLGGLPWPATRRDGGPAVSVSFVAGFAGAVPAPIKQAILLDVRRSYGVFKADADLKKEVVEGVGSQEWDVGSALDDKLADIIARMLAPYRRVSL